ncbi:hypothetical protein G4B88_018237 [Cannabis sativa]|uniref:RNase H type-1 domain-containing protein n=1 Tax=Cannabis sativa TaxID=3483 RepID=A0A7J6EAC2_CANSA|nr:hypothetical protein G4B88_018237 [Cannabis sativa]
MIEMMKLEIGIGTSVLALPSSFDVVKPNLDPYKHFLASTFLRVIIMNPSSKPVGTRNKGKSVITGDESDCTRSLMQSTRQQGAVGRTPSPNRVISQGAKKACIEKLWKEASLELGPNHIVVSHENTNFSTSGVSFSGAKKRKATVTIVPVITNGEEVEALGEKTPSTPITMLPQLDINTFVPGSSSREETSKRRSYNRKRGGTSSGGRRGARQNGKAPVKRLGIEIREELNAVGIGGGFALLWNGTIELEVLQASGGVFEDLIKESITSSKWCMFAVYGRPYDNEKRGFWDWMEDKINKCSLPWMVIGDLNLIAHPWEKCGGRKASTSDTGILQSFLRNTGGVDLGYRGCKFTWQNNRFSSGFTRERLDRAIVSGDWITAFPEAMKNRGFKPFRFFEAWARESSCEETIRWAWGEKCRPCGIISGRLNDTRIALRKWKNGAFGDCESLIKEAETRLGWIQEQPVKESFWSVKTRDRDSAFWRGILNTRDIICKGSMTLVGKGDSVDIWKQPWIPWLSYEEFTDLMNRVQPRFPFISTLADVSNPDGSWNMELLQDMFGDMLGTRIGNITRLPFRTNDTIVWKEASDGRFTVKRGYEANLGDSSCEDGKLWKKVWGKEIHFRHSVMIWRVIMGCIPTRDRLSFITEKKCPLCDGACESAIHIFWECHCARALWFSSPFPICCENGSEISVKEWLVWALERIPMELNDQFLCFTGCLFEGIWKARNNLLFKGKLVDIATVRESILRRYNEYLLLATTKEITEIKRVSIRPAVTNGSGWDNATDVFCMTDASWKDGRAGIAIGLLDRRQGKTFWFAKFLQSSSPAEAELLAIKWAMELAAERGCQSFAGASDAKVLIEALVARQCPPLWKLKSLALEVLNLCNSFNLCNVFYVKRVDNSACDAMARWARINAHCNGFL